MDGKPKDGPTRYGFRWGPMLVERATHLALRKGWENFVVSVKTDHHDVEVYVSRTGRSVRVWRDGKELKEFS